MRHNPMDGSLDSDVPDCDYSLAPQACFAQLSPLSVAPVSNPFFHIHESLNESAPRKTVEPTTAKVSFYEKHKIIYAKRVRGYFDNWRILLVAFTQVLFTVDCG